MYLYRQKNDFFCPHHTTENAPSQRLQFICTDPKCPKFHTLTCKICRNQNHKQHSKKVILLEEYMLSLRCFILQKQQQIPSEQSFKKQAKQKYRVYQWFIKQMSKQSEYLLYCDRKLQLSKIDLTAKKNQLKQLTQLQKRIQNSSSVKEVEQSIKQLTNNLIYTAGSFVFPTEDQQEWNDNISTFRTLRSNYRESQNRCEQYATKLLDVLVSNDFEEQLSDVEPILNSYMSVIQHQVLPLIDKNNASSQTEDCFQELKALRGHVSRLVYQNESMKNTIHVDQHQSKVYCRKIKELRLKNKQLEQELVKKKVESVEMMTNTGEQKGLGCAYIEDEVNSKTLQAFKLRKGKEEAMGKTVKNFFSKA